MSRCRARTLTILAVEFAAAACVGHGQLATAGDFPPPGHQGATQRAATSGAAEVAPPRTVPPMGPGAAQPLRLPGRLLPPQSGQATRNELASDVSAAPERLTSDRQAGQEQPIPLSAQTTAPKPAEQSGLPAWLSRAGSLGLVLGLFLLVVWAVRRGMPKSAALLPREALEIMGRAPLVGRQQVHLVRCGNKVLLLSVSATSVETLTEITDADEVERLSVICQRVTSRVGASFRQTLNQLGRRRDVDYLADDQAGEPDYGQLDDMVHQHLGGTRA